jgi:signal transduction protein with GAF and PtsI domain
MDTKMTDEQKAYLQERLHAQEELTRRLINILIMHAGPQQSQHLSELWYDCTEVANSIEKDYASK